MRSYSSAFHGAAFVALSSILAACGPGEHVSALALASGEDFSPQTALFTYFADNTNSAYQNTVNMNVNLNAGQGLVVGTCGVADACFSGDTYLRFFNPYGEEVASDDDACDGMGSRFVYVATMSGTHQIRAGCWGDGSCRATVGVGLTTLSSTYSATNTNSAQANYRRFSVFANQGDLLVAGVCDLPGSSFSGDTYLRLFQCGTATQLTFNDDGTGFSDVCGLGSKMTYAVPADGCFEVRAGCSGSSSCSGTLVIERE